MGAHDLLPLVAEPRRREILRALWGGERAAGEVHAAVGGITFGAVSQHLRRLREAGVVERRREGRRQLYRVNRERLGAIARMLESMWSDRLAELKRFAEAEEKGEPR